MFVILQMNRRYLIVGGIIVVAAGILYTRDWDDPNVWDDLPLTFLIFLGGFGTIAFLNA